MPRCTIRQPSSRCSNRYLPRLPTPVTTRPTNGLGHTPGPTQGLPSTTDSAHGLPTKRGAMLRRVTSTSGNSGMLLLPLARDGHGLLWFDAPYPSHSGASLLPGALFWQAQFSAAPLAQTPPAPDGRFGHQAMAPALLDATLFYETCWAKSSPARATRHRAMRWCWEAARRSNDEQLFQRATDIALQARAGDQALAAAQAWKQATPQSTDANRYVLQILIALNRVDDIPTPCARCWTRRRTPKSRNAAGCCPSCCAERQTRRRPPRMLEKALNRTARAKGSAAAAWTAIGRMRLQAGRHKEPWMRPAGIRPAQAQADGPAVLALELMENGTADAEALLAVTCSNSPAQNCAWPMPGCCLATALPRGPRPTERDHRKARSAPGWLAQAALQAQDQQYEAAEASLGELLDWSKSSPDETLRASLTQAYLLYAAQMAEKRGDYAEQSNGCSASKAARTVQCPDPPRIAAGPPKRQAKGSPRPVAKPRPPRPTRRGA